jgi:hypothetical protein
MGYIEMLADDANTIPYRRRLNKLTGDPLASILLQQVLFRWKVNGKKPFFKFVYPCGHNLYRPGDSWLEELDFSKGVFYSALKKIAVKITTENRDNYPEALVYYKVNTDRVTYYWINEPMMERELERIYLCPETGHSNGGKPDIGKAASRHRSIPNPDIGQTNGVLMDRALPPEIGHTSGSKQSVDIPESLSENEDYLILTELHKDVSYHSLFNNFAIKDDIEYRRDLEYWIVHNAVIHGSSVGDIRYALEKCVEKGKQGDMAYYTGILRTRKKNRATGITPPGVSRYHEVSEYLRQRLAHQPDILAHWDIDIEQGILHFTPVDSRDRHTIDEYLNGMILPDLIKATGTVLTAQWRMGQK